MRTVLKRCLAAVAVVGLVAGTAACATTASPESVLLIYDKGVNGGKKFKECIQPNKKGPAVVNDESVELPITKRSWNITLPGMGGDSFDPIVSDTLPTKVEGQSDTFGPQVKVWVKTEFYLNTDCGAKGADGKFTDANAPLKDWWERTGRRLHAEGDGWRDMLLQTLVPAQTKAVKIASRAFPADDVNTGADNTWAKMEAIAQGSFLAELNAANGGADYFCGPQFRRNENGSIATVQWTEPVLDASAPGGIRQVPKQGSCPPVRISVTDAALNDPAVEAARTNNYVEQQLAKAAQTKANSQANVAGILKNAGPGATELQRQQTQLLMEQERTKQAEKCAASSKCTLVIGGGVNVNAG